MTGEERGAWTSGGQGIRGVTGPAAVEQARYEANSGQGATGGGADGAGRVAG